MGTVHVIAPVQDPPPNPMLVNVAWLWCCLCLGRVGMQRVKHIIQGSHKDIKYMSFIEKVLLY